MFVARWLVESLIGAKDSAHAQTIEALTTTSTICLRAKETEISFLKQHVADLQAALTTERARADALTDRLLVKEAKVYPVQPAVTAAVEAAGRKVEDITKHVETLFESMNTVGEDGSPESQATATEIGGGRVLSRAGAPIPRPPAPARGPEK